MKRALAVCTVLAVLGFAGFSQIVIKGSWEAELCILPSITLSSSLSLTYTVAGFDITSTTGFGATGITSQAFSVKGTFGPFSVSGKMRFDPSVPTYEVGQLVTSFDLAGMSIGLTVNHWRDGEWDPGYFGYASTVTDPCPPAITGGNLQYVLTGKIDPLSVRLRYLDCSAGTYFQDLLVTLKGIELCCGIKYNAEVLFTKEGFDYLSISGINIPLCCGVSLDVGVKYTVGTKSLSITPKFGGFAEACFTVWGGPVGDFTAPVVVWNGIEIYGYKISCKITDCNYVEFVNAFNVGEVNKQLPSADKFTMSIDCDEETVTLGEFELLKLGFCGPGCCGGKYDVALRIFFGTGGGIFDITRFVYSVSLPIMSNFSVSISGTMYAVSAAGPCSSLCFGWTFTF